MKEEIKADAKRLIAEVYKRSALWNQKDVLYHNRDVTNRIWMELSALLGLPKTVLKAKWKGLRDTFRAEIKKEHVYNKNKFPRPKSVWIHYKRLQFLKEQMLPRPPIWERENCNDRLQDKNEGETTSSIKNGQSTRVSGARIGTKIMSGRKSTHSHSRKTIKNNNNNTCAADGNNGRSDDIKNESEKLSKLESSSTSATSHQTKEVLADNILLSNDTAKNSTSINNINDLSSNEHHIITVKHEPVDAITDNIEYENINSSGSSSENEMMLQTVSPEQVLMANTIGETGSAQFTVDPLEGNRLDDNYYFLMSLLPHIKTLPAERRMLLRMQMQELVYKEVYKKSNCIDSSSS